MSEQNTTEVFYKALADFSALHKATLQAKKDIKDLQKAEDEANASSLAGDNKVTQSKAKKSQASKKAVQDSLAESVAAAKVADAETKSAAAHDKSSVAKEKSAAAGDKVVTSYTKETKVVDGVTVTIEKETYARNKNTDAKGKAAASEHNLASALAAGVSALVKHRNELDNDAQGSGRASSAYRAFMNEIRKGQSTISGAGKQADTLGSKLGKALSQRSQLGGLPFAALIPIIGAVISAINPLISLLGAGVGAALGFANSLSSLAGAALALPGILSAVATGVASVLVAFSGFGGVFKAYAQQQKALGGGGGGGGGQSAADQANQLAQAEDRLARAQRGVTQAQQNLNKARQQAIRDLQDLQKAVARASTDESAAIANLEQAQQDYNNIFADSGSTKADKDKALANVVQAQQDLEDVRTQNVRNAQDLSEANQKGIEGSDQVVQAQNQLTDAYSEQRDALYSLQKAQQGQAGGGGGGGGLNLLQAALDKLSPSARKFAEGILAMAGAWTKLRQNVQEAFFSHLVEDLPRINGFLPVLENLLVKSADAMGTLADKAIKLVTSGPWTADFATLADRNGKLIGIMGDGALALLDALRNLTLAAGPFTEKLVKGLADGAKNFSELVQDARDSGRLATWLDKVYSRLQLWWAIVKNIGATLFNYGSAASDFGTWITTGFKNITDGWRQASEAANKPDSGFKKWLSDIKPLISDVRKLLGDFFGWLGRTSADPKNINTMRDLIDQIDTKLGPAIGGLLDTFSKVQIPETLISALTAIVEAVNAIMKNGGSELLKSFLGVVVTFFNAVADFAKTPGGGAALGAVASALGTIAAISVIGKLTGATTFIKALFDLAGKKGPLAAIFDKFIAAAAVENLPTGTGPGGVPIPGGKGTPTAGGAPEVPPVAGGAGALKGLPGGLGTLLTVPFLGQGEVLKPGTTLPDGSTYDGKLGGMSPEQLQKQIDKFNDPKNRQKGFYQDVANGNPLAQLWAGLSTALPGASGTINPLDYLGKLLGIGKSTPTTTLAPGGGGGKGGIAASGRGGPIVQQDSGISLFGGAIKLPDFGQLFTKQNPFAGLRLPNFGDLFNFKNPFAGLRLPNFGDLFSGKNPFAFLKLPNFGDLFTGKNPFTFLQLPDFGNLFNIKNPFAGLKLPSFGDLFSGKVPGISWPSFSSLFNIKIPGFSWPNFGSLFQVKIPGFGWPDFGGIFRNILPSAGTIASQIYNAVANAFGGLGGWLRSIFGNKGGQVKSGQKAHKSGATAGGGVFPQTGGAPGKTPRAFNTGGMVRYLAAGGRALEEIGGNGGFRQIGTDTIPAMLTPGEFVLRKGIVDAIGMKNLEALNEGMMSYSDLLNLSMRNQKNEDKQREKNLAALSGVGLAGTAISRSFRMSGAPQISSSSSSANNDNRFIVENLHINNPVPETASDSLPRTIRKVAYVGGRRSS